jgi:UDP-N-acetylmuramoyl-L-alanyl-D-glutamate--2,6-diaminopimelate ligase
MNLSSIAEVLGSAGMDPVLEGQTNNDPEISEVCLHSDQAGPGTLFCCVNGLKQDGHDFASQATEKKASALMASRPLEAGLPTLLVRDVRRAAGIAAAAVLGYPARHLTMAGVTGTNGKTTTAWIIRSIMKASGVSCGMLGTILYDDGLVEEPGCRTTPDATSIQRWLARMVRNGCGSCVMEASSHGIDLGRLEGCRFDALAFTNLTPEHLDFHSDMEGYFRAKLKFFSDYARPGGVFALNLDDPYGIRLSDLFSGNSLTYGINKEADLNGRIHSMGIDGTSLEMIVSGSRRSLFVRSPLIGRHNVSNVLAAAAVSMGLGIPDDAVVSGIDNLPPVPGRLQRFSFENGVICFIDYAHSPDGLEKALRTVGEICPGSVHVVFGHGGERTQENRPLLGRVAAEHAEHAVLTMDNPRSEDPMEIARQIESGFKGPRLRSYAIILDRREAVHAALDAARKGGVVLVAGKGPETTMILANGSVPYSDEESIMEWSESRKIPLL